jgi:hypothetical protein
METAVGLSHGRAQLRGAALGDGEKDRTRPEAFSALRGDVATPGFQNGSSSAWDLRRDKAVATLLWVATASLSSFALFAAFER